MHRIVFGRRLARSLEEVREEVMNSVESLGRFDLYGTYRSLMSESPAKLYNLAESFLLWRLRTGVVLVLIAALPTVFLVQQNVIIREQNNLLSAQNEFFSAQTELLRFQTDDDAISRSIADFGTANRVDYPQIERIADRFESLDLVRRLDQLNRLKALYDEGYSRQQTFEELRDQENDGYEMPWGSMELLEQYEYLSVFLLIDALMEHSVTNAAWVSIYKLDLGNSNFTGADLSNVYLYDSRGLDLAGIAIPPNVCDYPFDEDCP